MINILSFKISPVLGGIESTAWYLGQEFARKSEITYIYGKQDEDIETQTRQIIGTNNPVLFGFCYFFIRNKRERSVINFCMSYQLGLGAYLEKIFFKTPYIVLGHGNELLTESNPSFKTKLKYWYRKVIFNSADIVCLNSNFSMDQCKGITNNPNMHVVHPGVNFIQMDCEKGYDFYLLSVGRLIERKGFQFVIQAVALLKDKYPITYHIAGCGPYENELRKTAIAYGVENQVIFHGRVSEKEKKKLYQDCEVFIMPSFEIEEEHEVEGFGIVFIEANMYGKYVIASKSGGIEDAVVDGVTGSLTTPRDVNSIVIAIEDYYRHKKQVIDSKIIRKWAERFSYSDIAAQYENLMNHVTEYKL